jgi:hypothetical protein
MECYAMKLKNVASLFPLGHVIVSPQADAVLSDYDIQDALCRHNTGCWGELDEFGWQANNDAVNSGRWLESRHRSRRGTWFWVTTSSDRSLTAVHLTGVQ